MTERALEKLDPIIIASRILGIGGIEDYEK